MPKTSAHSGPSQASGTPRRDPIYLPPGVDLELGGPTADLVVGGSLQVAGGSPGALLAQSVKESSGLVIESTTSGSHVVVPNWSPISFKMPPTAYSVRVEAGAHILPPQNATTSYDSSGYGSVLRILFQSAGLTDWWKNTAQGWSSGADPNFYAWATIPHVHFAPAPGATVTCTMYFRSLTAGTSSGLITGPFFEAAPFIAQLQAMSLRAVP